MDNSCREEIIVNKIIVMGERVRQRQSSLAVTFQGTAKKGVAGWAVVEPFNFRQGSELSASLVYRVSSSTGRAT